MERTQDRTFYKLEISFKNGLELFDKGCFRGAFKMLDSYPNSGNCSSPNLWIESGQLIHSLS
jgi:hypothetical protein